MNIFAFSSYVSGSEPKLIYLCIFHLQNSMHIYYCTWHLLTVSADIYWTSATARHAAGEKINSKIEPCLDWVHLTGKEIKQQQQQQKGYSCMSVRWLCSQKCSAMWVLSLWKHQKLQLHRSSWYNLPLEKLTPDIYIYGKHPLELSLCIYLYLF